MVEQLTVTSPYDGSDLGQVPMMDALGVENALVSAHRLFRDRRTWLPVHERVAILQRTAKLMAERDKELALQAAREGGKPLLDSRVEVARAIDGVHIAIETIRADAGEVIPVNGTAAGAGRLAFTQKEPIGVVVAVSAFNHPLNLIVHQVIAAVAAGCPVIVKPAKDTPLSCHTLVELLHQAGLPKAWCQFVLPADHALAEALVTDSRVGFFSFIGSAAVGWQLRAKLAPGVRCALEHGGVAPVIVAKDADLEHAVAAIAKGGFYHGGQVCVSVQRVYIDQDLATDFAQRLATAAEALTVGDPASAQTEVGPLIRAAEVTRVSQWVDEAIQAGAQCLTGGEVLPNNCFSPTVLLAPPPDVSVSQKEVFGPVVCVYPYQALDEALVQANALPVAFQAAVFTRDLDTALHAYRYLDASAVMVNDHTAFRVDGMPFAGLRQSGLGVGGIPHTIADMQIDKMLVINSPAL